MHLLSFLMVYSKITHFNCHFFPSLFALTEVNLNIDVNVQQTEVRAFF